MLNAPNKIADTAIVPVAVADQWTRYADIAMNYISSGASAERNPNLTALKNAGVMAVTAVGVVIHSVIAQPHTIAESIQAKISKALVDKTKSW